MRGANPGADLRLAGVIGDVKPWKTSLRRCEPSIPCSLDDDEVKLTSFAGRGLLVPPLGLGING